MRIGGGAVSIADVTDRTARDLGFVRAFWLNEIRAGRAFIHTFGGGSGAGNVMHVQLKNPGGSGITVLVYQITASGAVDQRAYIHTHDADLTTDRGAGVNLLKGGAASTAHLREVSQVAVLGTPVWSHWTLANIPIQLGPLWGFELGAGEGILTRNEIVNTEFLSTWLWTEL